MSGADFQVPRGRMNFEQATMVSSQLLRAYEKDADLREAPWAIVDSRD
jgi:hypothetical protein